MEIINVCDLQETGSLGNGEYLVIASGRSAFVASLETLKNFLKDNGIGTITVGQITDALEAYLAEHPLPAGAPAARIAEVSLLAANWAGDTSPYSQIVEIEGITPYSQVDLTPNVEQLTIFHEKDLTFVTENEDGVVTVYAIGDKPLNDYAIQATIREVSL